MSISSLQNFSVKPYAGDNTTLLMPKQKYRFRVNMLGFGIDSSVEVSKQVVSVTRPNFKFEETQLDVYNSKIYLSGKPTFEPIKLVVRDDVGGILQGLVGQQVQKQFDFQEQAAARSGIDYKFTTRIEILDGGNGAYEAQVLETTVLYGCFIQSVDYGSLEYKSSDAVEVTMSIRFDNMEQWKQGATDVSVDGGIGAHVGRSTESNAATGAGSELTSESQE
jgi:hypothetical protein